jgi:hypothetical protein
MITPGLWVWRDKASILLMHMVMISENLDCGIGSVALELMAF